MIRTLLAVLVSVALVGMAVPAIQYGAAVTAEQRVGAEAAAIDRAATSLYEMEEVTPDDEAGAQRVVELSLPTGSFTTASVDALRIERLDEGVSAVSYRVEGRAERRELIDAPVAPAGSGPLEIEGGGDLTVRLTLETGPDRRIVVEAV